MPSIQPLSKQDGNHNTYFHTIDPYVWIPSLRFHAAKAVLRRGCRHSEDLIEPKSHASFIPFRFRLCSIALMLSPRKAQMTQACVATRSGMLLAF